MYRSLLFLDFDGTYWPRCSETPRLFDEFANFVTKNTDLAVVISSNWRLSRTLDELRGYFHPDIETRIIGTLSLEDDREPGSRQKLIERYVEQYLKETLISTIRFAVLDDNSNLFDEAWPPLILCDYTQGITLQTLDEVSKFLSPA